MPATADRWILRVPPICELLESLLRLIQRARAVDRLQILGHRLALLPHHVAQRLPNLMHDAQLNLGIGKHRLDRLWKTLETVAASHQTVLHPTVLKLGEYTQPEFRSLGLVEPQTQNLFLTLQVHP